MDIRYLQSSESRLATPLNVRSAVITFLDGVFNSQAETLPDVRDDGADESVDIFVKDFSLQPQMQDLAEDPYANALVAPSQSRPLTPKLRKLRKQPFSVTEISLLSLEISGLMKLCKPDIFLRAVIQALPVHQNQSRAPWSRRTIFAPRDNAGHMGANGRKRQRDPGEFCTVLAHLAFRLSPPQIPSDKLACYVCGVHPAQTAHQGNGSSPQSPSCPKGTIQSTSPKSIC